MGREDRSLSPAVEAQPEVEPSAGGPIVQRGRVLMIFGHEVGHELLHSRTGSAQFDDCGARETPGYRA